MAEILQRQRSFSSRLHNIFHEFLPKPGSSLFGGIFEVTGRDDERKEYDIQLIEDYREYIGRLLVETYRADSGNHSMRRELTLARYDSIKVLEILPAPYGYEDKEIIIP